MPGNNQYHQTHNPQEQLSPMSNQEVTGASMSTEGSSGKGGPGPPGPSPVHYPNAMGTTPFQPASIPASYKKRPLSAKSGSLYHDRLFEHCSNPTGKCSCSVSVN